MRGEDSGSVISFKSERECLENRLWGTGFDGLYTDLVNLFVAIILLPFPWFESLKILLFEPSPIS